MHAGRGGHRAFGLPVLVLTASRGGLHIRCSDNVLKHCGLRCGVGVGAQERNGAFTPPRKHPGRPTEEDPDHLRVGTLNASNP